MRSRRTTIFATLITIALLITGSALLIAAKQERDTMSSLQPISDSARTEAVSALHQSPTIAGGNRFAFALLSRLAAKTADQSNLFVSPFSIQQAILLTASGAAGETQAGLLHSLKLPTDISTVNTDSQLLGRLLVPATSKTGGADASPDYEWTLANAIWTVHKPGKAFAERCAQFYGADAFPLTGVGPINSWVNEKTHGRISQIISQLPSQAGAVLTNAVYFKGKWVTEFKQSATQNDALFFDTGDTQGRPLPRMNQTTHGVPFYEGKDYQAISLPYRGGMKMVVLLPNKGTEAKTLANELNQEEWQKLQVSLQPSYVHVGLPKFELEYSVSLLPELTAMGLPAHGDFSPMGQGPMFISDILHKTYLKVDEKGTEAAAATAVVMTRAMVMPRREQLHEFIVDRPFICAIVHQETNVILFLGVINSPQAPKS